MNENAEQKDPLKRIKAWEQWNNVRPASLVKRKDLPSANAMLKDAVDKQFITYMQILHCTNIVLVPVKVFCHMVPKNGCP